MTNKLNRFEKIRLYASIQEGKILSARKFSLLLDVAPNLVSRIENGSVPPSKKIAASLERKYDVSAEYYLKGSGKKPFEAEIFKATAEISQLDYEVYAGIIENLKKEIKELEVDSLIIESGISNFFKNNSARFELYEEFSHHLYNVLKTSGIASALLELLDLKKELAKPRGAAAEPGTVAAGGHTGGSQKAEPASESTEAILKIPKKPSNLDKVEAEHWNRNVLTLRRWEESCKSLSAPSWAVERYCREVAGLHSGDKLDDIGGILKGFIEEGEK